MDDFNDIDDCIEAVPGCTKDEILEALSRVANEYQEEADYMRAVHALLRHFPEGTSKEEAKAKPDDELLNVADKLDQEGDAVNAEKIRGWVARRHRSGPASTRAAATT